MVELSQSVGSRPVALPSRLPSLTGMRFVSAGLVFLTHAIGATLFADQAFAGLYMSTVVQGGWAAVSYFFILSGFVLTYAARSSDTAASFLRRRFFKIYPNYIITLLAALVLVAWVGKQTIDVGVALLHATLLQAYVPVLSIRTALNSPAWSLSCEALFYLCFPLLLRYISRIKAERLWGYAGLTVAAIFAAPFVAKLLPAQPTIPGFPMTELEMWFVMQFPPVRMLEFVFGMILARIVMTGRKIPVGLGGAVAIGILLYAVSSSVPIAFDVVAISVIPLGLIIAAGAVNDSERRTGWLGSKPMVWLGEVSYAFYMWHFLVLIYVRQWFGNPQGWSTWAGFGIMALLVGITLALSWALYSLVEQPIMRRFASTRGGRTAPAVPLPMPPSSSDDLPEKVPADPVPPPGR
ncbi:acyltransferase [Sphaerisporangium melleum]|uniref:Acyltransferase n=1 Tax=Sphaerisporangium melleum TaxID=321316 RepID=A0A917R5Z7_9ACTN|nr:acyltransferase [Sphaerisporangium melleum]GGK90973.1 acyltransferase [Sphaerisporangium melleum]GII72796.1 acyltransferase [Sphaerisporangium melleum]